MTTFEHVAAKDVDAIFNRIDKQWMLISATDGEHTNTMTASWGAMGILWHKPVAICFIRPQRYTKQFVDGSDYLTLSFFGGEEKAALTLLGRKSGRDCDKIKEAGLTPFVEGKIVGFTQAKTIFVCRKLYADELKPEKFIDLKIPTEVYAQNDYQTLYIVEIEKVLSKG
jgi:flavin reductase (DIM6/NTAB) family NADH-FMN oxidoreductase RutF